MKSSEASVTANEKSSDARKDARADKRDAEYAVAKEASALRCDTGRMLTVGVAPSVLPENVTSSAVTRKR